MFVLLTLAAIEYGVLPNLVIARHDVDLLRRGSVLLLVVAALLEAASVVAYTGLTRAVMSPAVRVSWPTQLGIDVTGLGAGHVLPGGGATSAALRYRLMCRAGIPSHHALTTTAVQTTFSDLALATCYVLGALAVLPQVAERPPLLFTALGGFCVLAATLVAATLLPRNAERRVSEWEARGGRLVTWVGQGWTRLRAEVLILLRDDSRTRQAAAFAMANWLLDAGCLWMCLFAFGEPVNAGLLLTAYGFACLLALLPLTPGGLGIVEATLIPLMIAFGVPGPVAVLGVLTWRVIQFWLPVPMSGMSYLSLRLSGRLQPLDTTDEPARR